MNNYKHTFFRRARSKVNLFNISSRDLMYPCFLIKKSGKIVQSVSIKKFNMKQLIWKYHVTQNKSSERPPGRSWLINIKIWDKVLKLIKSKLNTEIGHIVQHKLCLPLKTSSRVQVSDNAVYLFKSFTFYYFQKLSFNSVYFPSKIENKFHYQVED